MDDLLKKLYAIGLEKGIKLGLQNIEQLSNHFGNPHTKFKTIHVAGTNGKGSVCIKLAECLKDAGYKVGLFTSPHISSFRERFQINGVLISEESLRKHLVQIFDTKLPATFFEISTMIAFNYFADENVDYVVLETGMGGRFDATNCVTPILSIITSISLDHTEFLGKTVEEIGKEKAGIIKPNVPVILGPNTPGVPQTHLCHVVEGEFSSAEEENQAIAKKALDSLRLPVSKGLLASLPCRFEQMTIHGVTVILDIAHNPQGLLNLFKRVGKIPLRVICGISVGKDVISCLEIIQSNTNNIHFVEASNGRGVRFPNSHPIKESIQLAIKEAHVYRETVLICGSCFIMGEAKNALAIIKKDSQFIKTLVN